MEEFNIFYSWQSDLPNETNNKCIRIAANKAKVGIEEESEEVRISLDEATRNLSGSPNIPASIFDKIEKSDAFICDLSTINPNDTSGSRKTPNPNVLIELGYAISKLGWSRIIMLFNENYGALDDLPFDIDRHRASPYIVKDKNDKSGKNQLVSLLKIAISQIIEDNPPKPNETKIKSPDEIKRNKDVEHLRRAMNCVNINLFDRFLYEYPHYIPVDIFTYATGFGDIVDGSAFHIYDQELSQLIERFKLNWSKSLSYGEYFKSMNHSRKYKFHLPMDQFPNNDSENAFKKMEELAKELKTDFNKLLKFIRNNYLEIDLDVTSLNAYNALNSD